MKQNISNTAQIKTNNKDLIKRALIKLEQGTKIMVAKETGLSVATCNSLLNELSASEEIIETPTQNKQAGAGRPSKTYHVNERFHLICCLSFHSERTGKYLRYSIVDLLGKAIEENTLFPTELGYFQIQEVLQTLLDKYPRIAVISIGIPGIVNKDSFIESCDIEELKGLNLASYIKDDYGVPVILDNDMNLIAYGLYQQKHYKTQRSVVAISFFENICSGAGIVINGEVIRGRSNFAGEVSYLPLQPENSKRIKLPLAKMENAEIIARTVCAFITILNPDIIMLTGNSISINIMNSISEHCTRLIPEHHMPELTYAQITDSYYLSGLSEKALHFIHQKELL
ncbi:MAG: ROK family protein [Lachnospiraceae bacterium]